MASPRCLCSAMLQTHSNRIWLALCLHPVCRAPRCWRPSKCVTSLLTSYTPHPSCYISCQGWHYLPLSDRTPSHIHRCPWGRGRNGHSELPATVVLHRLPLSHCHGALVTQPAIAGFQRRRLLLLEEPSAMRPPNTDSLLQADIRKVLIQEQQFTYMRKHTIATAPTQQDEAHEIV